MSMTLDELRKIRDAILEHPDMERLARNVGHIISYLISEQEKRQQLNNSMDNLREELSAHKASMSEFGYDIRTMKERSTRNGKLLMTILGSVLSMVALQVLKLLK